MKKLKKLLKMNEEHTGEPKDEKEAQKKICDKEELATNLYQREMIRNVIDSFLK